MQVASLRTDHDRHATDLHCFFLGRADTVSENLEVDGNRGHVGQLAQTAFHRGGWVFCTVGFTDSWFAKLDVLETNGDVLVDNVELDEAAIIVVNFLVGSNADVSNDFLHSREVVITCRYAIVVRCKLVVDKAAFFEK